MKDDPKQTPAPDDSQHAADVTREQIKHIYEQDPPNLPEGKIKSLPEAPPASAEEPKVANVYKRTHKNDFDWREYHSAWQDYYQEYYRRYYHHINSKKALEGDNQQPVTGEDSEQVAKLKQDVVTQVKQRATKIKRSHHFWPLVTAAVVGLGFLFVQFNGVVFAQVGSYISPGALEGKKLVIADPTGSTAVGPESKLIVPKINLDIPINFDIHTLNEPDIQRALEDAAVHYKLPGASVAPGQFGNSVLLGHSSNDVFAKGQYKFAFLLIDQLSPGDTFYVHYQGTRYTYKVTDKKVIKPTELSTLQLGNSKPMLTLVTCTPAGTAINRLLVYSEQISPDPASATIASDEEDLGGVDSLAGNAKTLLEQFFSLFN